MEDQKTLLAELKTVMPNLTSTPDQQSLEGHPYLNAVLDAGLRLSYGSVSFYAEIFESPHRFNPLAEPRCHICIKVYHSTSSMLSIDVLYSLSNTMMSGCVLFY